MKNTYRNKIGIKGYLLHKFTLYLILFCLLSYLTFKNKTIEEANHLLTIIVPSMGNKLINFWIIAFIVLFAYIIQFLLFWFLDKFKESKFNFLSDFLKQIVLDLLNVSYTVSIALLASLIVIGSLYGINRYQDIFLYPIYIFFVFSGGYFIFYIEHKFESELMGHKKTKE